ncbi:hypothetical protein [Haloferax sp. DFSO52]|uniref:hypothetical protein n=1 Tax=Haloferax sp. DFSO52 TaxID=3388505 RepID=UPI003A83954C
MLALSSVVPVLLQLGTAKANEPIYGGTLVFGAAGLSILYLSFVRDEMDAGIQMKVMGFALLGLALLAAFWPLRPWPH